MFHTILFYGDAVLKKFYSHDTADYIILRNKGAAYLTRRREKSAAQAGDRRPSSGLGQTAIGFGVWTRGRRSGLVIGRGPVAVMMPLLLQVWHGRSLLQLLQLNDGPIRVRGRRR